MATAETIEQEYRLKAKLFGRIGRTHNIPLLRKVESLLDEKLPENVYILSAEEREGMNIARQQLDAGLGIPHEVVEDELNRWLDDIEISERQFAAGLGIPHEEVMKEFDALYPDDDE